MSRVRLSRILWIGAAALLVAAALVAIAALLRGSFSDTDGKILATLGATFLCGSTGLAGLALAERRPRLGLPVAVLAPLELALVAWWIWSGGEDDIVTRIGLSTLLVTIVQLAITTQLLLLRNARLVWLVGATGLVAGAAVALTVAAIWTEPDSSAFAKLVAVLWILSGLGWFLLPVLQRYTAAGEAERGERVLATLGDVELVAIRGAAAGVPVEVRLAPGERLVLRQRSGA